MEQFTHQDDSPERSLTSAAETDKKKKSKEKKEDKQSRFERIQAALRRALDRLLSSDNQTSQPKSHSETKPESEPKPREESTSDNNHLPPLPVPEARASKSQPADRIHTQLPLRPELEVNAGATTAETAGREASDTAWQRARTKVREFIQSKLLPDGSEETQSKDAPPGHVDNTEDKLRLTDVEREYLTVSQLEERYRTAPTERDLPLRPDVIEQRLASPAVTAAGVILWRRQRKQTKQLKRQQRQLKKQRRQIDKVERQAEAVQPPRSITPPAAATVQTPREAVRRAPTAPRATPSEAQPPPVSVQRHQTSQGETRVSYPPAPAPVDIEQPPSPLVTAREPIYQSVGSEVVDAPLPAADTARQPTVNEAPLHSSPLDLTEVKQSKKIPSRKPQSVAEIIRQRSMSVDQESPRLTSENDDDIQTSRKRARAQHAGGAAPSYLSSRKQAVATELKPTAPNNTRVAVRQTTSQTSVGWWQQALLVLLNIVLIGLLVRELVL